MRTFSQRTQSGDVSGRNILEARANQVIRLEGYRIDHVLTPPSDYTAGADTMVPISFLQVRPQASLTILSPGTERLDAFAKHPGNVGSLMTSWRIQGSTASFTQDKYKDSTGWMPCGFEVVGLWGVTYAGQNAATPVFTTVYTILFDWVSRSPLQVAALYTSYGFDPVDATEREVVGEIDFSMQMGDGEKNNLVG